jgi:hypothetical protein
MLVRNIERPSRKQAVVLNIETGARISPRDPDPNSGGGLPAMRRGVVIPFPAPRLVLARAA